MFILYRDMRMYGLLEDYYTEARKQGVIFVRYQKDNPPVVKSSAEGILVTVKDHVLQQDIEIQADILALSAGVFPAGSEEVGRKMKLNTNSEGYFLEAHVKLQTGGYGQRRRLPLRYRPWPETDLRGHRPGQRRGVAGRHLPLQGSNQTVGH